MEGNDPERTWIMPKVTGGITAAILTLFVLTGCAATDPAPDPSTPANPSPEATTSEGPLVAEPPEASPAPSEPSTPEEAFLMTLAEYLDENTQIPNATDEQLIAAGRDACAQLAEGTDVYQVRVIEGEVPADYGDYYVDSGRIAAAASETLCP